VHFLSKVNIKSSINVNYNDVEINNTYNTKFLGLITDNTLLCKDQINQLVIKLGAASFCIRILSSVMTRESLRMVYFAYVHSIMSYGIIFWGSSTYNNLIFKIQKNSENYYEGKK
jgi:hypothetical protein